MTTQIDIKSFDDLSNKALFEIFKARMSVFIVEQTCPYQDIDDADLSSQHLTLSQGEKICGYCRIIPPSIIPLNTDTLNSDIHFDTHSKHTLPAIGRMLVLPEYRGMGIARQVMNRAIEYCHQHYPNQTIYISAQTYLIKFYESLGFKASGEAYLEDDIEHIDMLLG